MPDLNEDLKILSTENLRFRAKALWIGDHPSPFDGFLSNYFKGLVHGTTHNLLRCEILDFLDFFRTVDEQTGKRRHEVLYPQMTWDSLRHHVGFNRESAEVWRCCIETCPDVERVEIIYRSEQPDPVPTLRKWWAEQSDETRAEMLRRREAGEDGVALFKQFGAPIG